MDITTMYATIAMRRMGEGVTSLPNDGEVEFAERATAQKAARKIARRDGIRAFFARIGGKPATGLVRPI